MPKGITSFKKSQRFSNDFALLEDDAGNQFIESDNLNLSIKIRKGGYIPRSGLLLIDYLNSINIDGDVLDIGTGETGILAHYMYARGTHNVIACDKDASAINHAKSASLFAENISWIISDIFSNIKKRLFDYIVSNPPQMPMPYKGNLHDYGGYDGRDTILEIIKNSPVYLSPNGRLFMLCFDFLGITENFNSDLSICMIASKYGLSCRVVKAYKKPIRRGGKTEESKQWINKIYPKYKFQKSSNGDVYYKIFILEFKHL